MFRSRDPGCILVSETQKFYFPKSTSGTAKPVSLLQIASQRYDRNRLSDLSSDLGQIISNFLLVYA